MLVPTGSSPCFTFISMCIAIPRFRDWLFATLSAFSLGSDELLEDDDDEDSYCSGTDSSLFSLMFYFIISCCFRRSMFSRCSSMACLRSFRRYSFRQKPR